MRKPKAEVVTTKAGRCAYFDVLVSSLCFIDKVQVPLHIAQEL